MSASCCIKPIARIIKVGDSEAGIVGLDATFKSVYASGAKDEEQIKMELLRSVKDSGNYITPGTEPDYKDALLREYRKLVETKSDELNRKNPGIDS